MRLLSPFDDHMLQEVLVSGPAVHILCEAGGGRMKMAGSTIKMTNGCKIAKYDRKEGQMGNGER